MKLIWHLVKKDLHRLRLPVVLLSLLTIGKIVFYAAVSGLFRAPDAAWLNLLRRPPEYLLRNLAEPLIVYFLIGWLVFEDSPVEKDAHWITRPISGLQLFAAKLTGAGLVFVLLPLALNLPWWFACGFDRSEIAIAAVELVTVNSVVVAMGMVCASLTDGFPRYALWSLVGLAGYEMVQLNFSRLGNAAPGLSASRLMVACVIGAAVGLALVLHQFATRRHRKSLTLAVAGILLVGVLGGLWPWNFTNVGHPQLAAEGKGSQGMHLTIVGPAHAVSGRDRYYAQLELKITDLPGDALVARIDATGEWSLGGAKVWSSRENGSGSPSPIRRIVDSKTSQPRDEPVFVQLPFSRQLAQRAANEPIAVQVTMDLNVFHGKIVAELPVREESAPGGARAYTISYLQQGPANENRRLTPHGAGTASPPNVVSFVLTERSADGLIANATAQPFLDHYALVNRGTGEFFRNDSARSGPIAITTLTQTKVACTQLSFSVGPTPVRLEEMTLAVIRFDRGESVKRAVDASPIPLVDEPISRVLRSP